MAKTNDKTVSVLLICSVTIGVGEAARLKPPGTTVPVSPALAEEIVAAKAGTLVPDEQVDTAAAEQAAAAEKAAADNVADLAAASKGA